MPYEIKHIKESKTLLTGIHSIVSDATWRPLGRTTVSHVASINKTIFATLLGLVCIDDQLKLNHGSEACKKIHFIF